MLIRIFALIAILAHSASAQCTPEWTGDEGVPGILGTVNAITTWETGGSTLAVFGGQFTVAGRAISTNVAAWNGSRWSSFGTSLTDIVHALCTYNGDIYVGTDQLGGGAHGPCLRRWNGNSWETVGAGLSGHVYALLVFGDELIVGGFNLQTSTFSPAHSVLAWNGSTWRSLGPSEFTRVYALAIHAGQLVRGGIASTIPSPTLGVAAWDGTAWQPIGNADATALCDYNGTLFAATGFRVSTWDGVSWTQISGSIQVNAFAVSQGVLVAGAQSGVFSWDGAAWHAFPTSLTSMSINAIAPWNNSFLVGGSFTMPGGAGAQSAAGWDGEAWQPLGSGMRRDIQAMIVYGSELIVGGGYASTTEFPDSDLVAWNGTSWRPWQVGSGPIRYATNLRALAVYSGQLIAVGDFGAGSLSAQIAAWDGQDWHTLAGGLYNGIARALCVFNGDLIAGGSFLTADGIQVNGIAAWNGSSWRSLGSGAGVDGTVFALTVFNGQLIVGGGFSTAGGIPARNIAAWDGQQWHALGAGVGGAGSVLRVLALAEFGGNLFVGGRFDEVGSLSANNFGRWNGSSWASLGGPTGNEIRSLTVFGSRLIIGGTFAASAGGNVSGGITAYDGTHSSSLGAGLSLPGATTQAGAVNALANYNGELFAAGSFQISGARVNSRIAHLSCACYANCDNSTEPPLLNINDFQCFLNRFAAADPYANCDGSTTPPVLNAQDFQCFLNAFGTSCP